MGSETIMPKITLLIRKDALHIKMPSRTVYIVKYIFFMKNETYAVLRTSGCNPYSLAKMKDVMDCGTAACTRYRMK